MFRTAALALLCTSSVAFADAPPAIRYAALSPDECEAELEARGIPFERETAPGVLAPVRLKGPLRGVEYRTNLRAEARTATPWEIADCRLVLALDDFAAILEQHRIVEVRHYSMYRKPRKWAEGRIGGQHHGGLALDAAAFIRDDGTKLDVLDDFKGRRGAKTCGPNARKVKSPAAIELREIVCAAVERQLFNVVLTPDFNRAHKNHFHLEVMAGVKWFMVR